MRRRRAISALALGGLAGFLAAPPASADELQAKTARLGWLDKITARVGELSVPVGAEIRLGVLSITAQACVRRLPPDDPESAAFLLVEEQGDTGLPREVFKGWMFASSPSLSAMDHGVYDVWVLQCVVPADQEGVGAPVSDDSPSAPLPTDGGGAPLD